MSSILYISYYFKSYLYMIHEQVKASFFSIIRKYNAASEKTSNHNIRILLQRWLKHLARSSQTRLKSQPADSLLQHLYIPRFSQQPTHFTYTVYEYHNGDYFPSIHKITESLFLSLCRASEWSHYTRGRWRKLRARATDRPISRRHYPLCGITLSLSQERDSISIGFFSY